MNKAMILVAHHFTLRSQNDHCRVVSMLLAKEGVNVNPAGMMVSTPLLHCESKGPL